MAGPRPNRDVQGKSSRRRYHGKMHALIRQGVDRLAAMRRGRAYAGGKTTPRAALSEVYRTGDGAATTYRTFAELGEVGRPIQIAKHGTFQHPTIGKFSITPEMCRTMAGNFKSRARGVDLAVDVNHDPDRAAVGWFKDVEARDGGLWATVEWNDAGAALIRSQTFRYFSPEFKFNHVDEETGTEFGPTLLGGGITNRPFLKGMEPLTLAEPEAPPAESDAEEAAEGDCHEAMLVTTRQGLIDALASYEPLAAVARVLSCLNAYLDADDAEDDAETGNPDGASALPDVAMTENEPAPPERSTEVTNTTATPAPAAPAAADANAIALAEVARLQQEIALKEQELNQRAVALAEREKSARTAELTAKFETLCRPDAAGVVRVTPGQKDPALAMVLKLNEVSPDLADAQLALLATNPGVKLGEVGSGESAEQGGKAGDAVALFESKIKAHMDAHKSDYPSAMEAVALAEPQVYRDYQAAQRAEAFNSMLRR